MTTLRDIRVFIASPNDVPAERACVERLVTRMTGEFGSTAVFHAIRWEDQHYKAHETFQPQIPEPSECDVVIVIFGNKLGLELPSGFRCRRTDGSAYPSGTAYELLSSREAAKSGKPDVYVFRRTSEPVFGVSQRQQYDVAVREQARLDAFFDAEFHVPRLPYKKYADAKEFETLIVALLRDWATKALDQPATWRVMRDGSPFPGLLPFDARHSRVFFGRDRKVGRAIEELMRARERERGRPFLLVVGASGSGKFSLVRAGVIPRMTVPGAVREVDVWRVAVMRPGAAGNPFVALAQALYADDEPATAGDASTRGGLETALPELVRGAFRTPARLAPILELGDESSTAPVSAALDVVAEAARGQGGYADVPRVRLLLLVDQLEEIFAGSVTDAQRGAFARLLMRLLDSGRVWLIATLRADLYAQMLDPTSPFLELKDTAGSYDLASPGPAEIEEILAKSAAAAGVDYEADPATGETLDRRLLREASGSDTLPLLQFTLQTLFEHGLTQVSDGIERTVLTYDAYTELGGLDGAIDKVAETHFSDPGNGLAPDEANAALTALLRRLAEPVRERRSTGTDPGRAALTAKAVPLTEAAPDALTRRLVDVMARARLLVLEQSEGNVASVRLAHERVLTSWRRAFGIVRRDDKFFRVRAEIETERLRWESRQRARSVLLKGAPLREAQALVGEQGADLDSRTQQFVSLSAERARQVRRLWSGGAAAIVGILAAAIVLGVVASVAQRQAAGNFQAAKGAADKLIGSMSTALRRQSGVSSTVLDVTFAVTDDMIGAMTANAGQISDDAITRGALAGYGTVRRWIVPDAPNCGNPEALLRTRSMLDYEFAETYHQTANNLLKAREKAHDSLVIRQQLLGRCGPSVQARADVAIAKVELGDIRRLEIEARLGARATNADFAEPRALFEAAAEDLVELYAAQPTEILWALNLSKAATKLGDLDLKSGAFDSAERRYGQAQSVSFQAFRAAPPDSPLLPEFIHELAWSYRKSGDLARERIAARGAGDAREVVQHFEQEVCVRRHLAAMDTQHLLWARDFGWGLLRLGDARMHLNPPDVAGARDAYYESLTRRLDLVANNPDQKVLFTEFHDILRKVADIRRVEQEQALADAFAQAAADIDEPIKVAFPDDSELPADEAQRTLLLADEHRIRGAGAAAMIAPDRRFIVEREIGMFRSERLPAIEHETAGCWDRLLATVTADASR
jgi:hypothetical protein